MSIFRSRATIANRLAVSVASIALTITSAETSHAASAANSFSQYGTASPDGIVSMLRLRIPFGGGSQTEARPTVALGIGPSWRFESESLNLSSYQYTPSLEAGITLGGDPILKLGALDVLQVGPRLWATADTTGDLSGVPNWVWWVGGGLLVVALAVALTASDDDNDNDCFAYGFCYEPPPNT
jgi:hypothetical protein